MSRRLLSDSVRAWSWTRKEMMRAVLMRTRTPGRAAFFYRSQDRASSFQSVRRRPYDRCCIRYMLDGVIVRRWLRDESVSKTSGRLSQELLDVG